MQTPQIDGGALPPDAEEATEALLARNGLDAEAPGHGWVGGKPRHAGELVGTTETAAKESKGGIGGGRTRWDSRGNESIDWQVPRGSRNAEGSETRRPCHHGPRGVGRLIRS